MLRSTRALVNTSIDKQRTWRSLLLSKAQRDVLLPPHFTISRCLAAAPHSAATVAAAATSEKEYQRLVIPPNLKIDERSSFAPHRPKPAAAAPVADLEDDDDDEDANAADSSTPDKSQSKKRTDGKGSAVDKDDEEEEDEEEYDDDDEEDDEFDGDLYFESPSLTPVIPLPDRLHVPVFHFGDPEARPMTTTTTTTATPEEVGTIWLNPNVFGLDPIRTDLLKRAVDFYRAKKRGRRKAHVKSIADIRGSGKKQRPQKGQGMARMGHKKAPHLRGGAKAHGPTNATNYGTTKLNKKVRRLAIRHVLSQKLKEGNLILVNQCHALPNHRTRTLLQWLQPFGIAGNNGTSAFILDSYYPDDNDKEEDEDAVPKATSYHGVPINLRVASANLHQVSVGNQKRDIKVYDVLKHEKLVLTLQALTDIEARFKND